jgi:hypothetical protein
MDAVYIIAAIVLVIVYGPLIWALNKLMKAERASS